MNAPEKARLYHDLGQLLRSGTPFPKALSILAPHSRGRTALAIGALRAALDRGATVPEAFDAAAPAIAPLEAAMFAASERAGRLENGLAHASEYYAAIAETRSRMWSRAAYPLFILHFGIVALALPVAFAESGGIEAFGKTVISAIALLWVAIAALGFLLRVLLNAASKNPALDRMLRAVPVLGGMRRAFALSRFCSAFNLQLEAGVNILTSLESAGRASGSAVIRGAADASLPAVRAGGKAGAALIATGQVPEEFARAFTVGEETGGLDHELRRLAGDYRTFALRRLEAVGEWLPKLLYLAILVYLAFRIVGFYIGRIRDIQDAGPL
jgi:type II secretory pathway component PulF